MFYSLTYLMIMGYLKRLGKVGYVLIALNLCFFALAFFGRIAPSGSQWVKGPLVHTFSAYSSGNAPKIFWVATAILVDFYVLFLFGLRAVTGIRNSRATRVWPVCLTIIAFCASFTISELFVRERIRYSPWFTQFRPHPLLLWWNRPGLRDFKDPNDNVAKSTNSSGFRYGQDVPFAKPAGEYRIFVLGNSSAFGHGVRDNEVFSARLEKLLRDDLKVNVRVINAACPGHTTYQNLIELKTTILLYHPDIIIVANNNDAAFEYYEEKDRTTRSPLGRRVNSFLYQSDYYLLMQRIVFDFRAYILEKIYKLEKPALVRRVSLEDYRLNLARLAETADRNEVSMVFVNMPVNYVTLERFPFLRDQFYSREYQDALVQFCTQNKRILCDADNEWKQRPEIGLFEINGIKGLRVESHFHPNARGHGKLAALLFRTIMDNGLLCPRAAGCVQTSLGYFIESYRQDAFDVLRNGVVKSITTTQAEIIFPLENSRLRQGFALGDRVRLFYEKGVVPLRPVSIEPIMDFGFAATETDLYKLSFYIEGTLDNNNSIRVNFHVRDTLSYMPVVICPGNTVDVYYSQGLLKPPMIRKISLSRAACGAQTDGLVDQARLAVEDRFSVVWFKLGGALWPKVAHVNMRFQWERLAAEQLFDACVAEVSRTLGMNTQKVRDSIDRRQYLKF